MFKGRILSVDDESKVLASLRRTLTSEGFEFFPAISGEEALKILEKEDCDVALVDYKMPGMSGIELVRRIKENGYDIEIIMVTAFSDTHLIVDTIKAGAFDYIVKPWEEEFLVETIEKALNYKTLKKEKSNLETHLREKYKFKNLIGFSSSMKKVFSIIEKVSDSDSNVLIHGESGTGKEQIAKAIHYSGIRRDSLFIPVDCVSINPNVIESELFGHVKGAYTGAYQAKEGLLKSAGDGSIFFDEIAEISTQTQAKLLRALQEKVVKPVGSNKTVKINARIIAATNKDIYAAVEKGEFREDLFYRLNVISIAVPPLREHIEDISPLVDHFIEKYNSDKREIKGITSNALKVLLEYDWPGNIRQLENCIERAFVLSSGDYIDVKDLPDEIRFKDDINKVKANTLMENERQFILKALLQFKGNKLKTANALDIERNTLYKKLKKYNIVKSVHFR